MNKKITTLIIVGILFAIIAPILFIQNRTNIDFTETGQIGDTIGGITAPIIGILSILLLFYTLWEQISFNKKQKELSNDEQFKSTFFNLLQAQRDIIEKIAGNFRYLGLSVDEEYPKTNNNIKITRNNKEFATIHNYKKTDNVVRGLDFFKEAKYQLHLIYEALDNEKFINNYDAEKAYETELHFQETFYHGNNIPIDIETEQDRQINEGRKFHRVAYTNDMYGIFENAHTPYRQMSEDKKIGLGYAFFFYKYESVGYYFRHIYRILKFIKSSEDTKILSVDEINKRIDDVLSKADTAPANKLYRVFNNKQLIESLDQIIYFCPCCKQEFNMKTEGNDIWCMACGSRATMDVYAGLTSVSDIDMPKSVQEWYRVQIKHEMESLSDNMEPIRIPVDVNVSSAQTGGLEASGRGVLSLDCKGWCFEGELNGEEVSKSFPIDTVPALPFDPDKNFQIYANGKYHAFMPYENMRACMKYTILGECAYRRFASDVQITQVESLSW